MLNQQDLCKFFIVVLFKFYKLDIQYKLHVNEYLNL